MRGLLGVLCASSLLAGPAFADEPPPASAPEATTSSVAEAAPEPTPSSVAEPAPAAIPAPAPEPTPAGVAEPTQESTTLDDVVEFLKLDYDIELEYRVRYEHMRPLALSDTSAESVGYFDHRARVGTKVMFGERVRTRIMLDILDGVLFGDNGSFVGSPKRNRGSHVATKSPNFARLEVAQIDPNGSSLDRDNYGYVLREAQPVKFRFLYGEALTPIGLIRAGRQPLTTGRNILINEGNRNNRWGVSKNPDTADALLFATKLDAIYDFIAGNPVDAKGTDGLIAGVLFGQSVENQPQDADDVWQLAASVYYEKHDFDLFGIDARRMKTGVVYTHRFGEEFDTKLHTITGYLDLDTEHFRISTFHLYMDGDTREISEGLSALGTSSGEPTLQKIQAFGGFAELAYKVWKAEIIFDFYYASGDDTPRSDQPINQLTFAEDTNVGLHLFENVVNYATARSAARGVTNLRAIAPPTYPMAEVNTYGGFRNGLVLFPQVMVAPFDWLRVRAGVMLAFTETRSVDPVGSILSADGVDIEDDLVNYAGGKPGNYWGTEIDVGLTLEPTPGFLLDLEGAYLIPGDALENEHGDAVDSLYGTLRLTYFYDGVK